MEHIKNLINAFWSYMSYEKITTLLIASATKIVIVTTIAIATRVLTNFAIKSIGKICRRKQIDFHTCHIINKAIKYTIYALGLIFALQNIGVDVSALVAALGISGVALSFGMKDTISNIIAGILIMIYKQFKIGDQIKIKDWQGTVIDINIRYTTLQTEDLTVFIPNSILYSTTMAIVKESDTK